MNGLAQKEYHFHRGKVMNMSTADRHRFAQIIGEHAVRMCDFAEADRTVDKKSFARTWAQVEKLNDEWSRLVCYGENPDSEFTKVTTRLVDSYSEAIGDFVIDRKVPENMEQIISDEAKFYHELSLKKYRLDNTKRQWLAYTHSILDMVNAMDRDGVSSHGFYLCAANCVRNGVLLGQWLDHSLYNKG